MSTLVLACVGCPLAVAGIELWFLRRGWSIGQARHGRTRHDDPVEYTRRLVSAVLARGVTGDQFESFLCQRQQHTGRESPAFVRRLAGEISQSRPNIDAVAIACALEEAARIETESRPEEAKQDTR